MTDTMTEAIQESYASSPTGQVILATLELNHPAWTAPARVVYDHQDLIAPLTAGGGNVTFQRCAFGYNLPRQSKDLPSMEIWVDNVSKEIGDQMKNATGVRAPVTVTYREYLSDLIDQGPQFVLSGLSLKKVKLTLSKVTGSCGFLDFINRRCPHLRFTATEFPGLVR